jgi:hypothetical protein
LLGSMPPLTPTDPDPGGIEPSKWQGTIKTVAIAGAVIAVVVGLRTVLK